MRIVTYNAENFFDRDTDDGSDHPKQRAEITAMARAINNLKADVIAYQEVESNASLDQINGRLRSPFDYYLLEKGNYYRGLHLGFLSRYPFWVTSHKDRVLTSATGGQLLEYADPDAPAPTPLKFQRDVLLAEFELPSGGALAIFNLHLKSKSTNDWRLLSNDVIRAAEAREARTIVEDYGRANPQTPVIVLGDFNDEQNRSTMRPLVRGLGFRDVIERDWIRRGEAPPYTYHKYPYRSRIDYLLLNGPALGSYQNRSVHIHQDANTRKASDHFPISIDLNL